MLGRRGASEVIAALLLISISVAACILLYAYASGLMGRLQGTSQSQPYLDQVSLEYYDWSGTSTCSTSLTTLCLTLRNVGATKIVMGDFFIAGTRNTTDLKFNGTVTGCAQGVLNVRNMCVITFYVPTGLTVSSGVAYSFKMVTKDGAVFSFSCIAGQAA